MHGRSILARADAPDAGAGGLVAEADDTGEVGPLEVVGTIHGHDKDSVRVLDIPSTDLVGGCFRDEAPVWHVPLDGSPAHKLADRATVVRGPVDPDTLLTAVGIDAERRATLIRIDLATRDEQVIDDHVLITSDTLTSPGDPTQLIYSVDDGERSGVWMARLSPAP